MTGLPAKGCEGAIKTTTPGDLMPGVVVPSWTLLQSVSGTPGTLE
jgi:hypothetical protein